jgi:hypothetical protein
MLFGFKLKDFVTCLNDADENREVMHDCSQPKDPNLRERS